MEERLQHDNVAEIALSAIGQYDHDYPLFRHCGRNVIDDD